MRSTSEAPSTTTNQALRLAKPGLAKNSALEKLFAREIAEAQARYELRKTYDTDTKEVVEFAEADYAA
ncbi:MAG: hypothetical protein R3F19_30745 [Verrucomicrobiales bacterium]